MNQMQRRGINMPFGLPQQGGESPYWEMPYQQNGIVGGFLSPLLMQWLRPQQQQQAPAKPKEPALKPMPEDIKALTSMTTGPNARTFDGDGFLGGLFRKG